MNEVRINMTCPVCGGNFKQSRPWMKYCSACCKIKAWQMRTISKILHEVETYLHKRIKEGFRF